MTKSDSQNLKMIYYPACKVDAAFPASAQRLKEYLHERWDMESAGCCRTDRVKLSAKDKAVLLCHTCAAILAESSAVGAIEYVWTLIDKDASFTFPDYGGEAITIQDCTMAKDYPEVMDAVRSLLQKMNFKIVELTQNREKAQFCGLLLNPVLPANLALAPQRFGDKEIFKALSPQAKKAYLRKHVKNIHTQRVVCYCRACHAALTEGGAEAVHILELLFPS